MVFKWNDKTIAKLNNKTIAKWNEAAVAGGGGTITGLTTMASWSEIWNAATQQGNTFAYWAQSTVTRNFREWIKNASISAGGTTIRLKLKQCDPAFTDIVTFSSCYIGPNDGTTNPSFSSTPTQVLKSAVGNFTLGYGTGYEYTDPFVFTIDEAGDYLVAFHINNQAFHLPYYAGTGNNAFYKNAADESGVVTVADYDYDTDIIFVAAIESDTSGYPFVYSADLVGTPSTVTENGNPLTNRGSIGLVNSNQGSWRCEGGKVYIRPTTIALDPPYMWS